MEDIKDRVKTGIDNAAGQAKQAVNTGANQAKQATDAAASAADKAKQGAANAGDKAQQGGNGIMDTVREGVQSAVNAVTGGTGAGYDKAKDLVHDAQDFAAKAGDRIQHYASDAYGATAEKVSDFGKELTEVVKKHPVPALLVGFGLGLILGRCMKS